MSEDVRLGDAKLEVEHVQEFALNAPDVSFIEKTSAH